MNGWIEHLRTYTTEKGLYLLSFTYETLEISFSCPLTLILSSEISAEREGFVLDPQNIP